MSTPYTMRTLVIATAVTAMAALGPAWLGLVPAAHAASPSFAGFGWGDPPVYPGDGDPTGFGKICQLGKLCPPDDAPTHGYSSDAFTPVFSARASTAEAGAHPDLTMGFSRPLNHCIGELPGEVDPNTDGDGFSNTCKDGELQLEQDLRRVSFNLPRGMRLDLEGVPYCDSYWDWLLGPDPQYRVDFWQEFCRNAESLVGSVDSEVTSCGPYLHQDAAVCLVDYWGQLEPGLMTDSLGLAYNERPRDGEDGHLVVLYPGDLADSTLGNFIRYDFTVGNGGGTVELLADPFPVIGGEGRKVAWWGDPVEHTSAQIPVQPTEFALTLRGTTGAEAGHPLLTNPKTCAPREIRSELQGYAVNAWADWYGAQDPWWGTKVTVGKPGEGVGASFSGAVPYDVTGCYESVSRPGTQPHDEQPFDGQPPDDPPDDGPADDEPPGAGPDSQHPSNSPPGSGSGNEYAPGQGTFLDATASGSASGRLTDLGLAVRSADAPIRTVEFRLDSKLEWGLRQRSGDRLGARRDGGASFLAGGRKLRVGLSARPRRAGGVRFVPTTGRGLAKRDAPRSLRRFRAILSRATRRAGPDRESTLKLASLPRGSLREVSV